MKNEEEQIDYCKYITFSGFCWIIQITVWIFEALLILNIVWYRHIIIFEYSSIINIIMVVVFLIM